MGCRLFSFVLGAAVMMAAASACRGQACTYSFNPPAATLVADPANYDGTVTFTVVASAPTCAYGIFIPFEPDYSTYQNTQIKILPGTQTYTVNNEYAPGGCCTSQANIVVAAFGPIDLGVFPAFSGSIAILPVLDPGDPSMNPSSLRATTTTVPASVNGQPYAPFQLQASGGTPPYTWICHGCTGNSTSGPSDTPLVFDTSGKVMSSTTFVDESAPQITHLYPVLFSISVDLKDAAGTDVNFVLSFANYPAGYSTSPSLPAAPTMLDPTPLALMDPKQSLMNGNQVTSSLPTLDTLGRAVQGIAADGTAEIVLRIPTNAANDIVTATVLSDACTNSVDPSTCAVSTSAALDGGVIALSNAANPSQAASTAPVTAADSNKFSYVIYRAPVDFVRLGNAMDQLQDTRSIAFKLTYQTAQGTSYGTQYVPLTIVRPPVVLTHGYASNAVQTWENFGAVSPHTVVYRVDYGAPIQLVSTIPAIACLPTCVTLVNKSDLGITYNTPSVATQTIAKLRDYALGHNAANAPVAASQVDSIGHSMGGVIERYWSTNAATNLDGTAVPFNTPDNFGNGYIHKLITLGTPHFGSPLATESISTGQPGSVTDPGAGCFRTISAIAIPLNNPLTGEEIKPARYEIGTAILDSKGTSVGGAIGDLDGDGIGLRMSVPLNDIKASAAHLPTFTVAGTVTPAASGDYPLIDLFCGGLLIGNTIIVGDPVATRMSQSLYGTIFDPALTPLTETMIGMSTPNDGAVPKTSALHGQSCNGPGAQCFDGDAHGHQTQRLVGASTNLVEDNNVLLLVQQLLNTSVADPTKWVVQ